MGVNYMKQGITHEFDLRGFRDYCEQNGFYRYIFASENQDNFIANYCLNYTITFYNIDILPDTYKLFIYNNNEEEVMYKQCYMGFDLVKRITVEELDKTGFFCEITLFCGKDLARSDAKRYKLIAQKKV